jgi:dienelactone hydrolase
MMVDAHRALRMLAQHPRIDPARIAVMGSSKGAVAAIYSSNRRFQQMYAPPGVQFAAHVGLYTPCNTAYRDDDKTTGTPIRLLHGQADDYVAIGPCRDYVARLKQGGADATLTEYPGATHAYDAFLLKEPLKLPNAQTQRNCHWKEVDDGVVVNANTGSQFSLDDPCVERGPQIAYNAAATEATEKTVKALLTSAFKLE